MYHLGHVIVCVLCALVCLCVYVCRELYKVRYVCDRRRVSRERLVMRGLNYVFRLLLLLLRSECGFFLSSTKRNTQRCILISSTTLPSPTTFRPSREGTIRLLSEILWKDMPFFATKESLGGDECPVLALKPASSTTELSKVSYVTYYKILSNERRVAVREIVFDKTRRKIVD